jgi:hypothetical protein
VPASWIRCASWRGIAALAAQAERSLGDVLSRPVTIGSQTFVPLEVIRSLDPGNGDLSFDLAQVDLVASLRTCSAR